MKYAIAWLHEHTDGKSVLVPGHEVINETDSVEDAKKDGSETMKDLPEEVQSEMRPIAVVELNHHMLQKVADCPQVVFGNEVDAETTFHNISDLEIWKTQSWWPL